MTQAVMHQPRRRVITRKHRRAAFVLCVLIPFAVWMLIYMLIPLVSVVMYSFTNAKMAYDDFSFVGMYQFEKLFGRRADKTKRLYNGMIPCHFYQYFKKRDDSFGKGNFAKKPNFNPDFKKKTQDKK